MPFLFHLRKINTLKQSSRKQLKKKHILFNSILLQQVEQEYTGPLNKTTTSSEQRIHMLTLDMDVLLRQLIISIVQLVVAIVHALNFRDRNCASFRCAIELLSCQGLLQVSFLQKNGRALVWCSICVCTLLSLVKTISF